MCRWVPVRRVAGPERSTQSWSKRRAQTAVGLGGGSREGERHTKGGSGFDWSAYQGLSTLQTTGGESGKIRVFVGAAGCTACQCVKFELKCWLVWVPRRACLRLTGIRHARPACGGGWAPAPAAPPAPRPAGHQRGRSCGQPRSERAVRAASSSSSYAPAGTGSGLAYGARPPPGRLGVRMWPKLRELCRGGLGGRGGGGGQGGRCEHSGMAAPAGTPCRSAETPRVATRELRLPSAPAAPTPCW